MYSNVLTSVQTKNRTRSRTQPEKNAIIYNVSQCHRHCQFFIYIRSQYVCLLRFSYKLGTKKVLKSLVSLFFLLVRSWTLFSSIRVCVFSSFANLKLYSYFWTLSPLFLPLSLFYLYLKDRIQTECEPKKRVRRKSAKHVTMLRSHAKFGSINMFVRVRRLVYFLY